jgi:hypothetical protein
MPWLVGEFVDGSIFSMNKAMDGVDRESFPRNRREINSH